LILYNRVSTTAVKDFCLDKLGNLIGVLSEISENSSSFLKGGISGDVWKWTMGALRPVLSLLLIGRGLELDLGFDSVRNLDTSLESTEIATEFAGSFLTIT